MISATTAVKIFESQPRPWQQQLQPRPPDEALLVSPATSKTSYKTRRLQVLQKMEFSTIPYHTIPYHTIFVIFGTQPRYLSPGLHQSLDVLLSWADPESCCTIAFAMTFSTVAINAVLYIIVVSVIWLTNRVFWVIYIVFWIINRVFSVLCFKADFALYLFDFFSLFHVLHILQTYSMFSHPGWHDSTICGVLFWLVQIAPKSA